MSARKPFVSAAQWADLMTQMLLWAQPRLTSLPVERTVMDEITTPTIGTMVGYWAAGQFCPAIVEGPGLPNGIVETLNLYTLSEGVLRYASGVWRYGDEGRFEDGMWDYLDAARRRIAPPILPPADQPMHVMVNGVRHIVFLGANKTMLTGALCALAGASERDHWLYREVFDDPREEYILVPIFGVVDGVHEDDEFFTVERL